MALFVLLWGGVACGGTDSQDSGGDGPCAGGPCSITWSNGPQFPRPIENHTTAIFDDGEDQWLVVGAGQRTENGQRSQLHTEIVGARISDDGSLGDWVELFDLSAPLSGHSQVRHPEGGVIYLGGLTVFEDDLLSISQVTRFRLEEGDLSGQSGNLLDDTFFNATAHVLNGQVIVLGGNGSSGPQANVSTSPIVPEGVNGAWRDGPSLPAPRTHHTSIVHDGRIYVFGGFNNVSDGITDVLRSTHDASGNLTGWEIVGQWDEARWSAPPFVHDGYIYLLGGKQGRGSAAKTVSTVTRVELTDDGIGAMSDPQQGLSHDRSHVSHAPFHQESGTVYSVGGRVGETSSSTSRVLIGHLPE